MSPNQNNGNSSENRALVCTEAAFPVWNRYNRRAFKLVIVLIIEITQCYSIKEFSKRSDLFGSISWLRKYRTNGCRDDKSTSWPRTANLHILVRHFLELSWILSVTTGKRWTTILRFFGLFQNFRDFFWLFLGGSCGRVSDFVSGCVSVSGSGTANFQKDSKSRWSLKMSQYHWFTLVRTVNPTTAVLKTFDWMYIDPFDSNELLAFLELVWFVNFQWKFSSNYGKVTIDCSNLGVHIGKLWNLAQFALD